VFSVSATAGLSSAAMAAQLSTDISDRAVAEGRPPLTVGVASMVRVPECGNQRCEIGEQCTATDSDCTATGVCLIDCPVRVHSCLGTVTAVSSVTGNVSVDGNASMSMSTPSRVTMCSGHGTCTAATGLCECFSGYQGTVCASCSGDFLPAGALCVYQPGAAVACGDGVMDGNEVGVDCGGPNCSPCSQAASGDMSALTNVHVIVVSVGGIVVGAVVLYGVMTSKACKRAGEGKDVDGAVVGTVNMGKRSKSHRVILAASAGRKKNTRVAAVSNLFHDKQQHDQHRVAAKRSQEQQQRQQQQAAFVGGVPGKHPTTVIPWSGGRGPADLGLGVINASSVVPIAPSPVHGTPRRKAKAEATVGSSSSPNSTVAVAWRMDYNGKR
jgi:hypothetical protein